MQAARLSKTRGAKLSSKVSVGVAAEEARTNYLHLWPRAGCLSFLGALRGSGYVIPWGRACNAGAVAAAAAAAPARMRRRTAAPTSDSGAHFFFLFPILTHFVRHSESVKDTHKNKHTLFVEKKVV